jgi:hypothetical protein
MLRIEQQGLEAGRVVPCAIYIDAAAGLEVRAGFRGDDLLRSRRTSETQTARAIAEESKRGVLGQVASRNWPAFHRCE